MKNRGNRKPSLGESLSWAGTPQAISSVRRPRKSVTEQTEKKCLRRANTKYFAAWDEDTIETMVSSGIKHRDTANASDSKDEARSSSDVNLLFSLRQGRRRAMSECNLRDHIYKLPSKVSSVPRDCPCLKERTTRYSTSSAVFSETSLLKRRAARQPLLKRHKSFIDTRILKDQDTAPIFPNWRRRNLSLKERPSLCISDSKRVVLDASVFHSSQCKTVHRNSCDATPSNHSSKMSVPYTLPGCPTRDQVLFPKKNEEMKPLEIEDSLCFPFSPQWKRRGLKRAPAWSNPNSPGISPLAKDGHFKF